MDSASSHFQMLRDLESRHEEMLRRLDELEKRIARVLAEQTSGKPRTEFPRGFGGPARPAGLT